MRRRQQGEEESSSSLLELITDRRCDRDHHHGTAAATNRSAGKRAVPVPVPRAIAVGAAIASHWSTPNDGSRSRRRRRRVGGRGHRGDNGDGGNIMFARRGGRGCWRGPSTSTALGDLLRCACVASILLASAWSLCFICWGGSTRGKAWYGAHSKVHFKDYKGGIPLMALAFPLLAAAAFCTVFFLPKAPWWTTSAGSSSRWRCGDGGDEPVSRVVVVSGPASRAAAVAARKFRNCLRLNFRSGTGGGDLNFHRLGLCVVAAPLLLYLAGTISRHLVGKNLSTNKKLMEVGNSFGMMAVVSLSWFLVPVSKHSIFLSVLGWSPIHAARLHIWSGRMCILGSIAHGTFHAVRWYRMGEGLVRMVIPPSVCFFGGDDDGDGPTCDNRSTDCTCYHIMRNHTGFLAVGAMVVVLVTSVHVVRRRWYRVFYGAHVTLGPLALILAVLHYNRLILYLAPSLLYYLASTMPVLAQAWSSHRRDGGVRLIDVRHIPDGGGCVEVSFDASSTRASATIANMAPCRYLQLCVPELSAVWHPFTVVPPPAVAVAAAAGGGGGGGGAPPSSSSDGCEEGEGGGTGGGGEAAPSSSSSSSSTVRIIFRATGPFTTKLSNRLLQSCPSLTPHPSIPPEMLVDGLYGGPDRLSQALRHDTVVMMAGGIGITPFLSLAPMLHSTLLRACCDVAAADDGGGGGGGGVYKTREVTLHWICRDEGLIDHVVTNYLSIMTKGASASGSGSASGLTASSTMGEEAGRRGCRDFVFRIVIHHTRAGVGGGGCGGTASKKTHDEELHNSSCAGGGTAFTIDDDDDDENGEEHDEERAPRGSSYASRNAAPLHLPERGEWTGSGSGQGSSFEPARFATTTGGVVGNIHGHAEGGGGAHLLFLRNVPSFVIFASISWFGLWIVWSFYVNVQSSKVVWTRSLGLAAVVAWSVVMSLVAVAIADRLSQRLTSSAMYSLLGWFSGPPMLMGDDHPATGEEDEADGRCRSSRREIRGMANGEGEGELEMRAANPTAASDEAGIDVTDGSGSPNNGHRRLSGDQGGLLELTPEYDVGTNQERKSASHAIIEHRDGRPSVSQLLNFINMADSPGLFLCGPYRMTTEAKDAVRRGSDWCGCGGVTNSPPCAVYEEVFGP